MAEKEPSQEIDFLEYPEYAGAFVKTNYNFEDYYGELKVDGDRTWVDSNGGYVGVIPGINSAELLKPKEWVQKMRKMIEFYIENGEILKR